MPETQNQLPTELPIEESIIDPEVNLWISFIDEYLENKPQARHWLGAAIAFTIEAVERGGDESAQKVLDMRQAVRYIYLRTPEHSGAFKVFEMSLVGYTKPQDELNELVKTALETAEAERRESEERQKLIKEGKPLPPIKKPGKGAKRGK